MLDAQSPINSRGSAVTMRRLSGYSSSFRCVDRRVVMIDHQRQSLGAARKNRPRKFQIEFPSSGKIRSLNRSALPGQRKREQYACDNPSRRQHPCSLRLLRTWSDSWGELRVQDCFRERRPPSWRKSARRCRVLKHCGKASRRSAIGGKSPGCGEEPDRLVWVEVARRSTPGVVQRHAI